MPDDSIQIAINAVDNASATLDKVGDSVEQLGRAGEEAGASAERGAKGFESFAGKIVAIQSGIGIAKEALQGLQQVWDFAKQGAENQRIAESFNRTAKSINADADSIIAKLDEAARGTVDDEELMQASTRALTLGVAKSGDDLVKIMQLARAASIQFGGDAGQAFESINYAIGNLAPRALKQFGIIVDLKEAGEAYAKANGLVAASLTEEQQRQALLNAVLEQGAKNFKDIGDSATTTAEKMKAVETRLGNILDIAKETAAKGISVAFDISDAPTNAMKAFVENAAKMRSEVAAGRMSVKDYNDGLRGMANAISPLVTGAMADAAFESNKLNDSFGASTKGAYGLNGALDESARAARRTAEAQAELDEKNRLLTRAQEMATTGAYGLTGALDESERAARRAKEALAAAADLQIQNRMIADATTLAIQYTESQKKQAEVQAKLDELNQKIASHGPVRTTIVQNEKLSTEELARTQLELAVAQEDLTNVQRKGGETDAEFALRVDSLKEKVSDYSAKLGEHTAVVGGATKAEQEQKKALEEQLATLQRADEIDRAKGAFEALTKSFRDGLLTQAEYKDRAAALNQITNLYTQSALDQATAQEVLLSKLADPRAKDWYTSLIENRDALDGVTTAEQQAADKAAVLASSETLDKQTKAADEYRTSLDKIPKEVKTTFVQTTTTVKIGEGAAERDKQLEDREKSAAERAAASMSATDKAAEKAISAVGDVASKTTDKVKGVADTTETRLQVMASSISTKFSSVASSVLNAFSDMASKATGDIGDVAEMVNKLPTYKLFTYEIKVIGNIPEGIGGAQSGADFIVPPNPAGRIGDYFPVLAAPGERVTVQTKGQQATAPYGKAGDTINYTYTTNVYNPLAAAMLADKQRRDRVARSNARMGVV